MPEALTFSMPALGADMERGILSTWLVKPGDRVTRGQVIAVVETHKGAIEVEFFHEAIVTRLLAAEGDELPVGTPLAELEAVGWPGSQPAVPEPVPSVQTPPPAPPPAPPPPATPPVASPPPEVAAAPVLRPAVAGRPPTREPWVRASPAARALAWEHHLDLGEIAGTGPHGGVRREDVEHAWERGTHVAPASVAPASVSPADPAALMRQAIAVAMAKSNREIPHYHLAHDIDLAVPLTRLAERNAARPPTERVLPGALLIWATAQALRKFPQLNGSWVGDGFRPAPGIHPGIATALRGGGLVTPALHDADTLTPEQIMVALQDLVQRARAGRLRSSEFTDATVTITSLGDTGVEEVHGLIYPPQVALVGFGRIVERPVAVNGLLGIHPVVTATLAGDHRATDGHLGGRFLALLDRTLQEIP